MATLKTSVRLLFSNKWPLYFFTSAAVAMASIMLFFSLHLPGQGSPDIFSRRDSSLLPQIEDGSTTASATSLPAAQTLPRPGLPKRLRVPSIDLDAPIEHVGRTAEGAMDVPTGLMNAAWFNLSPRPGENGSAVIDGHYGWKDGQPTVFNKLHTLLPGDEIFVDDEFATTLRFVVRATQTFSLRDDATEVFSSDDGQAHLNLITCEGTWSASKNSYSDRLVVFAEHVAAE